MEQHPLWGCQRSLIQYILSYPSHMEAVSIRNLRTHHAVLKRDPLNMVHLTYFRILLLLLLLVLLQISGYCGLLCNH
jgi:hypothetical protein